MKQKKGKEKSDAMVTTLEKRIREAIHTTPGIAQLPEESYCNVILDALDLIATGIKMRLSELREDLD